MKVRAQFYAQLRDLIGSSEMDVDLAEGATVQNIIQYQNISAPDMRERDLSATRRTRRGELENDLAAGLRFSVITRHAQAIQLQGKRNSAK